MNVSMSKNRLFRAMAVLLIAALALSLSLAFCISANAESVIADGRSFDIDDELGLAKDLESQPMTYEAWLRLPAGTANESVIFGNTSTDKRWPEGPSINFEISSAGKPALYIIDNDGTVMSTAFNYDVRSNEFVHIAITHETKSGGAVFKLYVNGEYNSSIETSDSFLVDLDYLQGRNTFMLARDARWRNQHYFKGNLKGLALYSAPLSAEEIKASYESGVNKSNQSLMAYYDLTLSSNNSSDYVKDSSGNGYDFSGLFYERDGVISGYDYSIAIVGDIQCLTETDAKSGTAYTNAIYDWLVKNKDSRNIQYVLSLGDITQNNNDAEWTIAKNQILKLNGANLPYSLINGNHDSVAMLDSYFKNDSNFTSQEIGYYSGTSLGNYYTKFTAGGNKYMVVALQWAPSVAIMDWASGIIAQNPDYQVMITTHGYLDYDGEVLVEGDSGTPSHYNSNNPDADVMWERLVSKHSNIIMVFSGHIASDNIIWRKDLGDNGNTVYQLLINPQAMDHAYNYETGMVAMLYFSNGGRSVRLEYVSTADSLEAGNKDVLFGERNQLDIELDDKGEIDVWLIAGQSNAVGYANDTAVYNTTANDPRFGQGFDNVLYYGYGERWISSFTPTKFGMGNGKANSGAEIGIAKALADTGRMNAIIKYAQGGTAIAPDANSSYTKNYGTWTPPTYISDNGVVTSGTNIGKLYTNYIDTVSKGIDQLRAMGYTPVIKGMWWMQGCAECYNDFSYNYEELLCDLISDSRRDIGNIMGENLSDMPVVFGKIALNKSISGVPEMYEDANSHYNRVVAAQRAVASKVNKTYLVDAESNFSGFAQIDTWHYDTATQVYIGKSFVDAVNLLNGEGMVSSPYSSAYSFIGGGLYKSGDSVTVSFIPREGYTISSVSVSKDGGAFTSVNLTDGKYTFTYGGEKTVFSVTTTGGADEATAYGNVPHQYSREDYPFAIFKNGSFLCAESYWGAAVKRAQDALYGVGGSEGSVTVLMRRNYDSLGQDATSAYWANIGGNFTLDLGGYVFTRTTDAYLFDIVAKSTDGKVFPTTITAKNGTVATSVNGLPIMDLNHFDDALVSGVYKHFDITFEDVIFKVKSGTNTGSGFIVACWEAGNNGMTADLTFTDCTFDLTNAKASSIAVNISGSSKTLTKVDLTFSGGKIIAGANAVTLYKTDAGDTAVFSKLDGAYTSLLAKDGANISGFTGSFVSNTGAALAYVKTGADGEYSVYTFEEEVTVQPIVTDYGTIPTTHFSETLYPFVVFKSDKTFVGGYSDLGAAITAAKTDSLTASYNILMRANGEANTTVSNLRDYKGTLTIDLGGKKLTLTDSGNYLLDLYIWSTSDPDGSGYDERGSYVIKNGSINKAGGRALINTNYGRPMSHKVKFSFTFEGVTFTSTSTKYIKGVILNTWENEDGATDQNGDECILNEVKFNDCTFDFKNSAEGIIMIPLKAESFANDRVVFEVEVLGGKIISDKALTKGDIYTANGNANGRADSLTFVKTQGGAYTSLEIASGLSVPTDTFNGDELAFKKTGSSGGIDIYTLEKAEKIEPVVTPYGTIPAEFSSIDSYPLVMFYSNGGFIQAHNDFREIYWRLFDDDKYNKDLVLIVRKSITKTTALSFTNKFCGSLTIDLMGNTVSINDAGNYLLDLSSFNGTAGANSSYTIKNGTLKKAGGHGFICFNYATSLASKNANFNFEFDGVTFVANSGKNTNVIFTTWEAGYSGASAIMSVTSTFTDCVFDMTGSLSGAIMLPLVKVGGNEDRVVHNVTVKGGKIIADETADISERFLLLNDNTNGRADSFSFAKDENGNYTVLELSPSAAAPDKDFGGLKFIKKGESGNVATYTLVPTASIGLDFTPKASVTLDSNLIFNIYIPAHEGLGTVTLNGTAVNLGEENEGYYLIATPLKANEAARELVLAVELTANGTPLKATFTFSTVKYAQKLLANAEISATEKTLIKDMLAYIASAYEYFNNGETVAEIVALLDGYVSGKVINVADAKCDTEGLSGATLVLGATPAIRFYLDGYTADKFSFKVGNRALNVTDANLGSDANGSYIEFTLFAYEMTETFTYEIEGTEITGEYNIVSYYADAVAKSDTALADIVAKFYNYCKSAYEYKLAVTNQ